MGPNRAQNSVKPKSGKSYIFRNVASAFPDNGKNMLLQDRALLKASVTGAMDQSPRQLRLKERAEQLKENKNRFSNPNKAFYLTPLTQKDALILSQEPKKHDTTEFFYQSEDQKQDDAFEPNNDRLSAFDISNAEDRWLGLLSATDSVSEGVQANEDWYKIKVSPLYRQLIVDLRYQHYLGDMDLKLYDSNGTLLATSQRLGEDEFINLILEQGGNYFLQVYGSNRFNHYDLKYSTHFVRGNDDEYEENDQLRKAFDLKSFENVWLSEIKGEGVAADDDYYAIKVPAGKERVQVDLRYDVNMGDVDVRLFNASGKMIASSAHIGDDDFIDFSVPTAGTYYLKIYPFSPQSKFNMYDFKVTFLRPSQKQTSTPLPKTSNPKLEATR